MNQRAAIVLMAAGLLLLGLPDNAGAAAAASSAVASDSMWDLSDLYPTPQAWAEAFARTQQTAEALQSYKGTLGASATAMFTALDAISAANREATRLAVYAYLKSDEDLRVAADQERRQQSQ